MFDAVANPESGEVLVTPHFSAIYGTKSRHIRAADAVVQPKTVGLVPYVPDAPEPFFVDWVSIRQTHVIDVPVIDDGTVTAVDNDGTIEWRTHRAYRHQGSYSTSCSVTSDGHTVVFSGNVSRFGRPDNLFGYSLRECVRRINTLMQRLGLPPFTAGIRTPEHHQLPNGDWITRIVWSGARFSRLDLTRNYTCGSLADARAYLGWLQTQQAQRQKTDTWGDCETVDFNRGSRRIYSKVYLKYAELIKHKGPSDIAAYCAEQGIVRFEVTIKSTQLISMGCYLGGLDMPALEKLFNERASVLSRAEMTSDDLDILPRAIRCSARDYLAGQDLQSTLSRRTFYRHRSAILPFGIDIAVKNNVLAFKPRVRVIMVSPAPVPSWYDLPSPERLAA